MPSWTDRIQRSAQYRNHGIGPHDVYEVEGAELVRIRRIQLRLYAQWRLDADMMRDMAQELGVVLDHAKKR